MPTTYRKAPGEVADLAKKLMRQHHQELVQADVTVTFLFADNEEGQPLTHGGYPAIGLAKINNLKDRVSGLADASIAIDSDWWQHSDSESHLALLDHELMHLEVKRNKAGAIKYDDHNRPCLRLRKHDFQIGGFHTIAKRHGHEAIEVRHIEKVNDTWRQMELFTAAA